MTESHTININVPILARVEGEGALDLRIEDGCIKDLKLRIFEPPRLFEKFLEGRDYFEVPDMVARICGICPVAYQMSAVHALEGIFGIDPGPWVRAMRRALYCGEWLQSHSLHIHLLAAPDFLGYSSVTDMARDYPVIMLPRRFCLQNHQQSLRAVPGSSRLSAHPTHAQFYHSMQRRDNVHQT